MPVESIVGLADQPLVEAPLTNSGLVAGYEQDSPSSRIEGEGNSPDAAVGSETQLLHVGVTRSLERIYAWAAQEGAECLQNLRTCKEFVLDTNRKRFKFRVKGRGELYDPAHGAIMLCIAYAVKNIYRFSSRVLEVAQENRP